MKYIELKNEILSPLYLTIQTISLNEKESAARRRFLRAVKPLVAEKEQSIDDLNKKHANKDDQGNPKMLGAKEPRYDYTLENRRKLNKEAAELNAESVKLDVLPSNEVDIAAAAVILRNEVTRFKAEIKEVYKAGDFDYIQTLTDIAEALEAVKEDK